MTNRWNPVCKCLSLIAGTAIGCILLPVPSNAQQKPAEPQTQQPSKPSDNPFPDDTTNVPVLPNATTETAAPGASNEPAPAVNAPASDEDPVRSPDQPVGEDSASEDRGFSSSSAGLDKLAPPSGESDTRSRHGRKEPAAEPTHAESAKEDENVGAYYLGEKNWRAALSRFQSALVLDPENPDVYWGLAEAERHTGDLTKARQNYLKVLEYDPDSKHAKEARKILAGPELAHAGPEPQR